LSLFLRQTDLVNQNRLFKLGCTIVGCGAGGSFTALTLTKLGVGKLVLYDMDVVEPQNIANQFFRLSDLGKNKALITKEICEAYKTNNQHIEAHPERFVNQPVKTDIVLALTDTIEARQDVFKQAVASSKCLLYIDARMLANDWQIYTVNTKDYEQVLTFWKDYLEDLRNQRQPCTASAIIYNVLGEVSHIVNTVKRFVNEEPYRLLHAYNYIDNYQVLGALNK